MKLILKNTTCLIILHSLYIAVSIIRPHTEHCWLESGASCSIIIKKHHIVTWYHIYTTKWLFKTESLMYISLISLEHHTLHVPSSPSLKVSPVSNKDTVYTALIHKQWRIKPEATLLHSSSSLPIQTCRALLTDLCVCLVFWTQREH